MSRTRKHWVTDSALTLFALYGGFFLYVCQTSMGFFGGGCVYVFGKLVQLN